MAEEPGLVPGNVARGEMSRAVQSTGGHGVAGGKQHAHRHEPGQRGERLGSLLIVTRLNSASG